MVPVATVGVAVTLVILSALVVQQRGGLGPDQRSEMLKGESSSVICNFRILPKHFNCSTEFNYFVGRTFVDSGNPTNCPKEMNYFSTN